MDIGSDLWFPSVNAGLENAETLNINARLIRHLIKKEKVSMWYVWGDIEKINFDAVKDPQFVVDARVIREWHRVRKDIKVIFMYRNAKAVAESMMKHPEWTTPVYRLFPEMIEKKNDEFLRMCERLDIPVFKFKYPNMLDGSPELFDFIGQLPFNAQQIWDQTRVK